MIATPCKCIELGTATAILSPPPLHFSWRSEVKRRAKKSFHLAAPQLKEILWHAEKN